MFVPWRKLKGHYRLGELASANSKLFWLQSIKNYNFKYIIIQGLYVVYTLSSRDYYDHFGPAINYINYSHDESLEMPFKNLKNSLWSCCIYVHVLALLSRILLIDSKLICQQESFALKLIFLHLKLKHIPCPLVQMRILRRVIIDATEIFIEQLKPHFLTTRITTLLKH